jgi:hypothetical protein
MALLLLSAAALHQTAHAQLAIFSVNSGQETPVAAVYDFGKIATGDTRQVVFRIRNTSSSPQTITTLAVSGAGFSFVNALLVPIGVAVSSFKDVTVSFAAGTFPNYSANLQVNSISVLLLGSSAPSATISSGIGCTGPLPTGGTINFGNVQTGKTSSCLYSLRNLNNQTVVVTTFTVSGDGFSGPVGVKTPLTLLAGEIVNFNIVFSPTSAVNYLGLLTIDSRTFDLAGNGVAPLLGAPILNTQTTPLHSGQQRTLTVELPSPAPLTTTGTITISTTPDSPLIQDDPTVMFVTNGSRSIAFTVNQGDTQALLAGKPSAVFQTGAASGRIKFSVSASVPFASDPTRVLIVPADVVSIDNPSALKTAGALKIQFGGLDNTLAAGAMKFTFYDPGGNPLNGGSIQADFTPAFRGYFSTSSMGGMFLASVNFTVSGDASQIGFVEVQITNPAGTASTQRLAFP